jgi:hydroxymethylpyrimidine kinase/phosphomethylpyrimidine kinase
MNYTRPVVLTVAGSDSGGGAGIQADLKTMTVHGCFGVSVVTALTAQNTVGVQGIYSIPPDFIHQQLTSIFDDFDVASADGYPRVSFRYAFPFPISSSL